MRIFLLILALVVQTKCECNKWIREKYCSDDICLNCQIGPTCPISGQRAPRDGTLMLRGMNERSDEERRKRILSLLDQRRINEAFTSCVPFFQWDSDLAELAQAWADQCAMVEYSNKEPRLLHHDRKEDRQVLKEGQDGNSDPGIAQSVHWARSKDLDLTSDVIQMLLESQLKIEDGLIDGFFSQISGDEQENVILWGHATHVGCGWIQFPLPDVNNETYYENFMVCNYAVGTVGKSSCETTTEMANHTSYITYYSAPAQVIEDVKKCLNAVKCRRKRQFRTTGCNREVEECLAAESGLKFLQPSQLRSVARSTDSGLSPIDVEASKCKIDTILCSLNASFACKERIRRCLPLLDLFESESENGRNGIVHECQCADDIILADGTFGKCTDDAEIVGRRSCLVKESPCVVLGSEGQDGGGISIEVSVPVEKLGNLIHQSYALCNNVV